MPIYSKPYASLYAIPYIAPYSTVNMPNENMGEQPSDPYQKENPYKKWNTPFINVGDNNLSTGDFVNIAGALANAIAPNEWSGRMGMKLSDMASKGLADYNKYEKEKRDWELAAPDIQMRRDYQKALIDQIEANKLDKIRDDERRIEEEKRKIVKEENKPYYLQALLTKLGEGDLNDAALYAEGAGNIGNALLTSYINEKIKGENKQKETEAALSYLNKAKDAYDNGDIVSMAYYMGLAGKPGSQLSSILKEKERIAARAAKISPNAGATTSANNEDKLTAALRKNRILNAYKEINMMPLPPETKARILDVMNSQVASNPDADPDKFISAINRQVTVEPSAKDKIISALTFSEPKKTTRPMTAEEYNQTLDKISSGEIDIYRKPRQQNINNLANLRAKAIAQLKADGKPINEKYIRYVMEQMSGK